MQWTRCKMTTSSAALPHLQATPWSIFKTCGSIIDVALKMLTVEHLKGAIRDFKNKSLYSVFPPWLKTKQCDLKDKYSVQKSIPTHFEKHTLRNSFLSTCWFPSMSSILKAMWNPVWGSAPAHTQLSSLRSSFTLIIGLHRGGWFQFEFQMYLLVKIVSRNRYSVYDTKPAR